VYLRPHKGRQPHNQRRGTSRTREIDAAHLIFGSGARRFLFPGGMPAKGAPQMLRGYLTRVYNADDNDDPQGGTSPKKPRPSDLAAQFHNDAMRLSERLAEVLDDNFQLREKNRKLTTDLTDARAKAPAADSVVLTKEQAAQWEAFQALNLAPADIKTQLEAATTSAQELATLKRSEAIRAAAEAQGYKAGTLGKLPSLAGKDLVVKDVEIEGKKVKQAFVQIDGKDEPLAAYVEANDPEFLPALAADTTSVPRTTTSVPSQSAGAGQGGDKAAQFIQQQAEARSKQPNPLMKQGA
jgi:hypothetical protein